MVSRGLCGALVIAALALCLASTSRPVVWLQRLYMPLQAMIIEPVTDGPGYEIVTIPAELQQSLESFIATSSYRKSFLGEPGNLEDYIIHGPTTKACLARPSTDLHESPTNLHDISMSLQDISVGPAPVGSKNSRPGGHAAAAGAVL
mmetsp:Transcript_1026/g.1912  ORF Transcript_1026/g.1912 Transcript_1026/m.1912 type:complete len:147 (+) Transcript_1026:32-472(+)